MTTTLDGNKMVEKEDSQTLVPTSGVPFEDQVRIIRAYVVLSDSGANPVYYKDVMQIAMLGRTQISGVNSFMVMLGLLERCGKGKYKPTKAAVDFSDCESGNEDFSLVRMAVERSALSKLVLQYLKVHGGGLSKGLIEYIMKKSRTKKQYRVGTALEWLIRPCIIEREDNEKP